MSTPAEATALDPEDAKLVTLARGARLRAYTPHSGRPEGAAVRDGDGRTYAAATVDHADERLATSAVRGAFSAAASSGARTFEAVVLVTEAGVVCADDLALIGEFAADAPVLVADPSGAVVARLTAAGVLGTA